jgi:hypothetical protein
MNILIGGSRAWRQSCPAGGGALRAPQMPDARIDWLVDAKHRPC